MKTITGITNSLTEDELSQLDSFVSLYNKISHKLYVDLFIKKLPIKKLCPAYQTKYSINKRHFDSIRKILEGKVSSILALNKNYIIDTKDKIKTLEKNLAKQTRTYNSYKDKITKNGKISLIEHNLKKNLNTKIKYNQQRLDRLNSKLKDLEEIRDTGNVRLCFGSNKLFRQQFLINSNNNLTQFKSHEQWYEEFNYQRNKQFTFVGSRTDACGNYNAQITHIKDNLFNLKLNINPHVKRITDRYINLTFKLDYEIEILKKIILNNDNNTDKEIKQPLTVTLIKQPSKSYNKDKYVVSISFEKQLVKKTYTSKTNGCLGVDINQDHLAVSNLDNKGNLLTIDTFHYDLNGNKHQNSNSISLAVKDLIKLAVKLNKPIVIEQLDFTQKKKSLKASNNQYFKNRNKQLSSFAYSKIIELIKARAEDNYIEVREVNPAYTSMIGNIKYSVRSRISVHHGAAICIGRKGLFNKITIVKVLDKETKKEYDKKVIKEYKEKRISSRNRQVKNLVLPERKGLSSIVYWKELKENMMKEKRQEKESGSNVANQSTSLGQSNKPVMNVNEGTKS